MKKPPSRLLVALLVVGLGAGAIYWAQRPNVVAIHDEPALPAAPAGTAPPVPEPVEPAKPAINYPLAATDPAAQSAPTPLPSLAESDPTINKELQALLPAKDILTFLIPESLVRHVVATVDNLGRSQAPKAVWPVHPIPGRFATAAAGSGEIISADNAARYRPFVAFVESIDSRKAVALYVRMYPLFQQAYVELGFPKAYFNDRLVGVIDLLLATPKPAGDIGVSLVEVKGPIPSLRPWVRYEFTDPALKSLSAGQKILLRTGDANHRRIDTKLAEVRKEIVAASMPHTGK